MGYPNRVSHIFIAGRRAAQPWPLQEHTGRRNGTPTTNNPEFSCYQPTKSQKWH